LNCSPMKKLPIGIQSFEKLRRNDFCYVDKTYFVKRLAETGGGYYFLARPRRFGKSLFLDTIRQAFLCKKELFQGLYLQENWDWNAPYPVLRISFGSGVVRNLDELKDLMESFLIDWRNEFGVTYEKRGINGRFMEAIIQISRKFDMGVVVLIDEYDKPILDNIERPDLASEIRDELKNFFAVLKDADEYLRFLFITGVTKFSKVSLFSGLNQLQDITLNPDYATICGYTQDEFQTTFSSYLGDLDLEKVSCWYDGYSWLGEKVYNPFDILLYLSEKEFRPYWFETGTPTFLIKLLLERRYYIPKLEDLIAGEELLGSFDLDRIYPENLLFQTGYLTIREKIQGDGEAIYRLAFPNKEVRISLNNYILNYLVEDYYKKQENKLALVNTLRQNDFKGLKDLIHSFFASIPTDWYRKNELSKYEGYYASIVYAYFVSCGFDVKVEDSTNMGRIDMAVFFDNKVYIIEFKVVEQIPKGAALEQIKQKRYWEKYKDKERDIYIIGIEFSSKERNLVEFEWERV